MLNIVFKILFTLMKLCSLDVDVQKKKDADSIVLPKKDLTPIMRDLVHWVCEGIQNVKIKFLTQIKPLMSIKLNMIRLNFVYNNTTFVK